MLLSHGIHLLNGLSLREVLPGKELSHSLNDHQIKPVKKLSYLIMVNLLQVSHFCKQKQML